MSRLAGVERFEPAFRTESPVVRTEVFSRIRTMGRDRVFDSPINIVYIGLY